MKKITVTIKFISILFVVMAATASLCPGQEAGLQSRATPTLSLSPNPAAERQRAMAQKKAEDRESPLSAHKINYFTANRIPTDPESQIKFQVSAKYRIFNWMGTVPGGHLSPYFAYSQKSLWNYGQASKPFEESNYNPEFFVDYRMDRKFGDSFVFRNIFLSPFEHESNGLAGPQSRSWNRAYIAFRAGFFPIGEKVTAANPADRFEIYLKLWHPWGYSDEEVYLQSIGSTSRFLDYAGRGELQVRARLVNGDWGNQLNATTRIIHDSTKNTLELEFLQRIADWNIIPYVQYWRGYNETLLRFDRFQRRLFVGFALWY